MLSSDLSKSSTIVISAKQDRKVFRPKRKTISGIPSDISENPELLKAIKVLPPNYNFEIPKTIWRIKKCQSQCVALQFPEGLLIYALTIADILENFTSVQTIIMGDVTYGACCIDDFTARALGADLMVHYGHSCLIPVNVTKDINMLYIFVDIKIDNLHVINTIQKNFNQQSPIALVSTIQFVSTLQHVAVELRGLGYSIQIPQCKPLSPGEVLGCTSPEIKNADIVIFVGDGRFHLESAMIKNPSLIFYRYNPYDKTITEEKYDYEKMTSMRKKTVDRATQSKIFGLILGTLGRQGSPLVLENITTILKKYKRTFVTILLSEIFPEKLNLISHVDSWIQVACPRLSIDWGSAFSQPLLTPYELVVVMKEIEWQQKYPMDFYASQSLGVWTPNHTDSNLKASCGTCKDCSCEKPESKTNV